MGSKLSTELEKSSRIFTLPTATTHLKSNLTSEKNEKEKCYNRKDSTLKFVNQDDEMDCK